MYSPTISGFPNQVPHRVAAASACSAALLLPMLVSAQTAYVMDSHFARSASDSGYGASLEGGSRSSTSGEAIRSVHAGLVTLADSSAVLPSDDEIFADGFETPRLGAHVLLTQDESLGTPLATTPAIATQTSGSSFVAVSMGWNVNFATPSDSYHNSWTPQSGMNVYAGGDFYTAVWAATVGTGGSGHTLSVAKTGRPAGEISLELMEVLNGGDVQVLYRLAPAGDETPGSVTVSGPATLIAIWAGDSFQLSHTAVPDNGFVVFDSYLKLGPSSGVQVALASKQVTAAGTYTVNWASTPFQNAACYLIAVQRLH